MRQVVIHVDTVWYDIRAAYVILGTREDTCAALDKSLGMSTLHRHQIIQQTID